MFELQKKRIVNYTIRHLKLIKTTFRGEKKDTKHVRHDRQIYREISIESMRGKSYGLMGDNKYPLPFGVMQ